MKKNEGLFPEFPKLSREEWEKKIAEDLKGAPYRKLITKTIEGIDIKPYYHAEDLKSLKYLDSQPGEFPYTRSTGKKTNEWDIRQDLEVENPVESNKNAVLALNRGADSLCFIISNPDSFGKKELEQLLSEIYYECIRIHFKTRLPGELLNNLAEISKERNVDTAALSGSINSDPLEILAETGKLDGGIDQAYDQLADRIKLFSKKFPGLRQVSVNADLIHNAGASSVQELACALSMTAEHLDRLTDRGLSMDDLANQLVLNFSTGPNYFMEIAKFRAARLLFANLVRSYNPGNPDAEKAFIHASTSEWNQTIFDPYVNMLRSTTESMSAILGNVDSFSVTPFDTPFRKPTAFSERIARNTQIILKEEAHLDKVLDPASGSYYIESLSDQLAEDAWNLFLEIEESGGFAEALKKGTIQSMIEETARTRDINLATRKEILLGTNQYPNQDEKPAEIAGNQKTAETAETGYGIVKVKKYRGAMAFEDLRIKTLGSGKDIVVFLLTYGNINWRKARAGFASGFFACAGYRVIDNNGFESIDEGLTAARKAKADIIVLCSSDDDYPEIAPEALSGKEENTILVVAGYPKDSIDELKAKGINNFIHVKSNLLEELKMYNELLGIK